MRQFHKLLVRGVAPECRDAMRIRLDVPESLRDEYSFLPGQHLPIRIEVDGKFVRRTYSICSARGTWPLEIGVRIQPAGVFSQFVAEKLAVGDTLEVMPPFGQFHANNDPANEKTYLAFAAGSGITPILSIMRSTLEAEPGSRFVLFYGNRRQQTTMFIDDLQALKNRFPERVQLFFLFSREEQEFPIMSGRLDGARVRELMDAFCRGMTADEAFICGPDTMIDTVDAALRELGVDAASIHAERYGPPRRSPAPQDGADPEHDCTVTVILDGHKKSFDMSSEGASIVDAAAANGIELPYSCKGGVCATCRTLVREGQVRMDSNYGLEPWEVENGYVLACQSHPVSDRLLLDYDAT